MPPGFFRVVQEAYAKIFAETVFNVVARLNPAQLSNPTGLGGDEELGFGLGANFLDRHVRRVFKQD